MMMSHVHLHQLRTRTRTRIHTLCLAQRRALQHQASQHQPQQRPTTGAQRKTFYRFIGFHDANDQSQLFRSFATTRIGCDVPESVAAERDTETDKEASYVTIGNTRRRRGPSRPFQHPDLMVTGYLPSNPTPSMLTHLEWIMKKDLLGQDVLLIGPPGSAAHQRRTLALAYAEMLQRPVQVVTITSDLTEADLKQRRELRTDQHGNLQLTFVDAAPVAAALHGHLLILDGLEKASRNVLPTLNNLLEHRSINLEDGRLLVKERKHGNDSFITVHKDFRVIALSVPTPPWPGRALDPPLRSRFQIRRVDQDFDALLLQQRGNSNNNSNHHSWLSLVAALQTASSKDPSHLWPFPTRHLSSTLQTVHDFPHQDPRSIFLQSYPIGIRDDRLAVLLQQHETSRRAFDTACKETIDTMTTATTTHSTYAVQRITRNKDDGDDGTALVEFTCEKPPSSSWFGGGGTNISEKTTLSVPCGNLPLQEEISIPTTTTSFLPTKGLQNVITSMLQAHATGNDIRLMGPPGESKSATAAHFASLLGYKVTLVHAFSEMTFTDLFLRRVTSQDGETVWEPSALATALQDTGCMVVLDNVDKLRSDVLASLATLCIERDVQLPDGRRILRSDRFERLGLDNDHKNDDSNAIRVHPNFRLVALASCESSSWFSQDVMSMFRAIIIPPPTEECSRAILKSVCSSLSDQHLDRLLALRSHLTPTVAIDCGVSPLSTRNMIRITRRCNATNLHDAVCEVLVADLLPPTQREALESVMQGVGIKRGTKSKKKNKVYQVIVDNNTLSIGAFQMIRKTVKRPELVPSPNFFDIPSHVRTIKDLLEDWTSGERAFLLLGNQGVGKNMVVDRLCEVANFEREYIQLHRDSTIGQITLQASLEDGKILWKDSPLVRAVTNGRSLVVDEADKAPTEVLAVLKGLVEDGELLLGDGRKISRHECGPGIIAIHPDFTLWILANRPGFPFLGNAFFKQIGDCFSTRVVANPDLESEINLLRMYGPNVDPKLVEKVAKSFAELRSLCEHGDLTYPYSAREAVAVVKHLEAYPEDNILTTLHNVLDFDSFDEAVYATLGQVFERHGIAVRDYAAWQKAMLQNGQNLKLEFSGAGSADGTSHSPPALGSPKEGKWDENNDIHVGGNQWAGGTGGSDTAGLGGRGGPYRLDRGHKVHQVSDETKAEVSKEATRAARAMAKRALHDRLSEIDMSESEWDMYQQFVEPISKDIATLQAILKQVDAKQPETGWVKRQSQGELDESRLVDGMTGDAHIYKRRGRVDDAAPSQLPKRMRFVMDVSGSMYRFNGYDNRLIRCLEAANLIMESFDGLEQRFDYSIVGHSGDSPCIPFVEFQKPAKNAKERMRVLQAMIAHAQYCQAGDHTLPAMDQAIRDVSGGEDDGGVKSNGVVIAISDANLQRYGIAPRQLGKIMEQSASVKAHCIFLASFGQEAYEIKRDLPVGRGHVCMQTSDLPRVVRNILSTEV